mgnify:CR=1 FL=1
MKGNKNLLSKRKSEFDKNNKIRLQLLSFAQSEINEKKKSIIGNFSFSSDLFKKNMEEAQNTTKLEKKEIKPIIKQISLASQKTLNDSSDISEEENSSDLSCVEEEI